ncbi:hypothetical protein [Winogradskyella flava]|uniref:Uncharacterized protein n=1 Tax=Winogradskyella flava TaxID=1884876 RepID=A0A842IYX3_9FLAO|nr:hypothetical protein [Winogradskyella flava]MBC2846477.1 hypothetical protein [Winogradskyella flava]
MKKLITLCLFALAMLAGTQSITAQSAATEISKEAIKQTKALSKSLDLEDNQKDNVYDVLKEYLTKKDRLKSTGTTNNTSLKKLDTKLLLKMEAILTKVQFEKYKTLDEL